MIHYAAGVQNYMNQPVMATNELCDDGYSSNENHGDHADNQPIRFMAEDCDELFDECLARSVASHKHPLPLQILHAIDEYHRRFHGWCRYLVVLADDKSALDYRLRNHEALQDMIIRMLDMLRRNLFLVTVHDLPSANGEVTGTAPLSTIDELLTGINDSIIRLNKIAIAIRSSSRSTSTARARRFASQNLNLTRLYDFEDRAYFALHCLYPNASETLVQQLLNSMTDRYAKLFYEAYRTKANSESRRAINGSGTENAYDQAAENRVLGSSKEEDDRAYEKQQTAPIVIPATSIDTARLNLNLKQAVAATVLQSKVPKTLTAHADHHIREPRLPKFKEGEDHISCEWCHQIIDRTMLNETLNEWSSKGRRHYRQDLQPYVCLAEDCQESRPSFASSREWFTHMVSNHTVFWSSTVHNQPAWTCTGKHENNSIYTFSSKDGLLNHIRVQQCRTWPCTGKHEGDSTYAFFSRDELVRHILEHQCNGMNDLAENDLEHPEHLVQSMRQASSCPLCLFSMSDHVVDDQDMANDTGDKETATSWTMGSHIADHLHHLAIISLQIMRAMQGPRDKGEGDTQSELSGPSSALFEHDKEVRKQLESSPENIQEWMNQSDFHEDVPMMPVHYDIIKIPKMQDDERTPGKEEAFISLENSMADLPSTHRDKGRRDASEELEAQTVKTREAKLSADHANISVNASQLGALASGKQGMDDLHTQGGDRGNALQAAAFDGHELIVRLLLDTGADVNAQSEPDHRSALYAASLKGHEQIVKLLLDHGADVNGQVAGDYGNALCAASFHGYEQVVKLLLDKDADTNALGGKHRNALFAAVSGGQKEIAQLLLNRGAKAVVPDGSVDPDHSGPSNLTSVSWNEEQLIDELVTLAIEKTKKPLEGEQSDEHPHALLMMNDLANIMIIRGRPDEAVAMWRKVVKDSRLNLGEVHPSTLAASTNLTKTLIEQGKIEEAVTLQDEVVEKTMRVLGKHDPSTLSAMNDLAAMLSIRDQTPEAVALLREVLEERMRLFGQEHPDTLSAEQNLAAFLRIHGNLDEAASLQRELVGKVRLIRGEEHPVTFSAMTSLLNMRMELGKLFEAGRSRTTE